MDGITVTGFYSRVNLIVLLLHYINEEDSSFSYRYSLGLAR